MLNDLWLVKFIRKDISNRVTLRKNFYQFDQKREEWRRSLSKDRLNVQKNGHFLEEII